MLTVFLNIFKLGMNKENVKETLKVILPKQLLELQLSSFIKMFHIFCLQFKRGWRGLIKTAYLFPLVVKKSKNRSGLGQKLQMLFEIQNIHREKPF